MTSLSFDTIVAQATPSGRGGVAIVRVSGSQVKFIINTMLRHSLVPRHATYLPFYDHDNQVIDEGIAIFFPSPHSFTGEDIVEFHCHGGPIVVDLILQCVISLNVRLARPGEFSERAFLNGKMDLTQVEAVADLINASSVKAARSAVRSMVGEFSKQITSLLEKLIEIRMWIESSMDFSDEEIDFLQQGQLREKMMMLMKSLEQIVNSASEAVLWTEGITLVLAGKPNVGKSSLLNALVERYAAIVTEIPGTTRDVIRETFQWHGILVQVLDTAGLRHTEDVVEQEGVRRTRQALTHADCVFWVMDARDSLVEAVSAVWHIEGVQP